MRNDGGNFWTGFLVGTAIGAGAGLLLAPSAGIETRARIRGSAWRAREQAGSIQENLQGALGGTVEKSRSYIGSLRDQISIAVQAGREAAHEKRLELQEQAAEVMEPKPSM